jgi:chorismate-pyruvate lyase
MPDQRLRNVIDQDIDFARLAPVLRVLLLTDGTVTHSLAAYFAEDIEVRCLRQVRRPLTPAESLQLPIADGAAEKGAAADGVVIEREVLLLGCTSGTAYAHAYSTIRTDLLDPAIQDLLDSAGTGIGELLSARNLETYREIIHIGFCDYNAGQSDPFLPFTNAPVGPVIARDYLIRSRGKAVIKVREEFPLFVYGSR